MNGSSYVLDTNAVIQLLRGNQEVLRIVSLADALAISVITELEFLSYSKLSNNDIQLFEQFKSRIDVVSLETTNTELMQIVCNLRLNTSLKMPDAIVAATAVVRNSKLITADVKLLNCLAENSLSFTSI
ncbi:PIN domain-containing protein [Thiomicrospira sp. ALE5]|uniref:PIN domain-containing protein n=1 Tax=Thiomicrospira sp. ALE5 TaxID=748650 RepID=UPI0008F37AEB|nr:PIN domain-containing protein [Thiomicrospira sp. ALE5]SFR49370.1 hypothetical protein SAMN03092900_0150 [Thiomicrospira sp. ALE5]